MASTTIWTFRCPVSTCNFSTHVPKNRLLHSMFCRLGEAFDPPQRGKVMHFNCPECGRSYTTKGSMKRHQNLTHGVPLVMVAPCSTPPSVWLPGPFLNSRFRSQVILVNLYFDIILTTLPFFLSQIGIVLDFFAYVQPPWVFVWLTLLMSESSSMNLRGYPLVVLHPPMPGEYEVLPVILVATSF